MMAPISALFPGVPSKVDGLMVEVVLDEPGTPPQAGDTVSDPAGNDDRVLQSLSLGAAQGWWLIEGQLIL